MSDTSQTTDPILEPLEGDSETGSFVRYTGDYTRIEEARRLEDPNLPRGVWQRSLKQADWDEVVDLCRDTLEHRSKDLQIAVWMIEAMVHRDGLAAIGPGLELIIGMCERFWDGLFPEIDEDGDASARSATISWIDDKLAVAVMSTPIVGPPDAVDDVEYNWTDYHQARHLEGLRSRDPKAVTRAEQSGTVTMPMLRAAVEASETSYYVAMKAHLDAAVAAAERIEALFDDKLGDDAPGMTRLRRAAEEVAGFMQPVLATRLPAAPAAEAEAAASPKEADMTPEGPIEAETAPPPAANAGPAPAARPGLDAQAEPRAGEPAAAPPPEGSLRTAEDAHEALLRISAFLKTVDPHSPSPYLVEKAVQWGRMPFHEVLRDVVDQGYDFAGLMYLLGVPSGRD